MLSGALSLNLRSGIAGFRAVAPFTISFSTKQWWLGMSDFIH